MTSFPARLTEQEVNERFIAPLIEPDRTVFDLALVLNGTVSAGAWTAGVLDFLIQALDCWQDARGSAATPRHRVRIAFVSGASGGGVNAAILGRNAQRRFTPVSDAANPPADNPLWNCWVNDLAIAGLAGTEDLEGGVRSLLDGTCIDRAASRVVAGSGAAFPGRDWIGLPLRIALTITSLQGVPYATRFQGGGGLQYFVDHTEVARFLVGRGPGKPAFGDESEVGEDWQLLAAFAKASAAFPGGFPARRLSRAAEQYRWRVTRIPQEQGPATIEALVPVWPLMGIDPDGNRTIDAVDGGVLNNQPLELARTALAGVLGRLERDSAKARAATLLVDPFEKVPDSEARALPPGLFATLGGTLSSMVANNRYATSDLLLATDSSVASRFLLSPRREHDPAPILGGAALATARLGAFAGFLERAFRVHDFMLGRANAQGFLREGLALDPANPLFLDQHGPVLVNERGEKRRALIPLLGQATEQVARPEWPGSTLDHEALRPLFNRRINEVVEALLGPRWFAQPAGFLAGWRLAPRLLQSMQERLDRN